MGRTKKPCPGCGVVDGNRPAAGVCESCQQRLQENEQLREIIRGWDAGKADSATNGPKGTHMKLDMSLVMVRIVLRALEFQITALRLSLLNTSPTNRAEVLKALEDAEWAQQLFKMIEVHLTGPDVDFSHHDQVVEYPCTRCGGELVAYCRHCD